MTSVPGTHIPAPASAVRMGHGRELTGDIVGLGSGDVVVEFESPFADAALTVTASVVEDQGGESLRVRRIRSVTATQALVNVINNAATARSGVVHVIAVHD